MDEEKENSKNRCENCRRDLLLGYDVIAIQNGVIGGRGFVPLDDLAYFCCDRCVRDFYGNGVEVKPRIP